MYRLAYIAVLCGFLAAASLLAGLSLEKGRRARRIAVVSSAGLMLIAIAIIAALLVAPRAVCDGLGGRWDGPETMCVDEWGGNADPHRGSRLRRHLS
jgi:hypothetical protein